jgi:hypothetical protein
MIILVEALTKLAVKDKKPDFVKSKVYSIIDGKLPEDPEKKEKQEKKKKEKEEKREEYRK